jgi:hypothetical protein
MEMKRSNKSYDNWRTKLDDYSTEYQDLFKSYYNSDTVELEQR